MKISASNIAWNLENDEDVYQKLKNEGFSALEIAPTRWIPQQPYLIDNLSVAASIAKSIQRRWGFDICSMQSIWYGIAERIFGTPEEREFLFQYTCSALDFASAIGCPHVVFGSPKNRIIEHPSQRSQGELFFAKCASYAQTKGVIIGIEANPASYGTNYLTNTSEALELVLAINSPFLKLNLDLGTMLQNEENLNSVKEIIPHISHVHISEPALVTITNRPEHLHLARLLKDGDYRGWVSVEMRNSGKDALFAALETVAKVFK
jgi:sugar phosphate isomerase/epimerase